MNEKQRKHGERGADVSVFTTANAADFLDGSKAGELAARLKAELVKLSALDVAKATRAGTRQQSSTGRSDLRKSLHAQVAAVCDTAEVISLDHTEIKGRCPRTRADNSDLTLIAVARSFVEAATPLKALFIE